MVTPYIVFDKQCEEAVNFYEKVFRGKNKEIMRYNDYVPDIGRDLPADISHYVLHAKMEIFDTEFTFADELKAGGEVILPPMETFYSSFHTTVKDRFGILWNIIVIDSMV